jgi:hypothetical protein
LAGRIDRVEHREDGTWLFDYKSALRNDLPGRYERQLLLYASLYHELRGEWPVEGRLIYPLTSACHEVALEPTACEQIAAEARKLIMQATQADEPSRLAAPGDTCKICEFRPWCGPFWTWQARERDRVEAIGKAFWGFEGRIVSADQPAHHWKVAIEWREGVVTLVAPIERLPQLKGARAGMHLRILECSLVGPYNAPRATVREQSEVFLLDKGDGGT